MEQRVKKQKVDAAEQQFIKVLSRSCTGCSSSHRMSPALAQGHL